MFLINKIRYFYDAENNIEPISKPINLSAVWARNSIATTNNFYFICHEKQKIATKRISKANIQKASLIHTFETKIVQFLVRVAFFHIRFYSFAHICFFLVLYSLWHRMHILRPTHFDFFQHKIVKEDLSNGKKLKTFELYWVEEGKASEMFGVYDYYVNMLIVYDPMQYIHM